MYRSRFVNLLTVLAVATSATATGAEQEPSCGPDANYAAFDFWLGQWEVFVDGSKVGDNVISREEGGCLLLERWTDVQGNTGQSYNFYNPDTGLWRQVWVSRTMTIDYAGGPTDDGSMQLEGTITYFQNGRSLPFLGRWTPLDDGSVLQYFEQLDADSGEMVPIFSAIYRRRS